MTLPLVLAIGLWVLCLVIGFAAGFWTRSRPAVLAVPEPREQPQDSPLLARARVLTAEADRFDAGGEYKRHVVYARLLKEFPGETKRLVSRTIEEALT